MARKTSIKAVCIGVAVGVIGSSLASIIVATLSGTPLTVDKLESEYSNNAILVPDLLLSLVFVFLSGYVAAKIGKEYPMRNSIVVGLIQLVIIVLTVLPQAHLMPVWYTAAILVTLFPTVYFGGKIASGKKVG